MSSRARENEDERSNSGEVGGEAIRHNIARTRKPALSRRAALGLFGAGVLGVAASGSTFGTLARADALPRVAVIGGGMSGIMTAWLLDGQCAVMLLESEPELGGNARSIDWNGHRVDVGAQYFSPRTHPGYFRFVQDVLQVPVVLTPLGITVTEQGVNHPVFVSPSLPDRLFPLLDPLYAEPLLTMAIFTEACRQLEASGDWAKTVQQFVDGLLVSPSMKRRLLFPLAAALAGCTISQGKTMSARAAFAFVSRARKITDDLLIAPFRYYNAVNGLRDVVDHMVAEFTTVSAHTGTSGKVTKLARNGAEWQIWVNNINHGGAPAYTVDHVVLALPPEPAEPLVRGVGGGVWTDLGDIYGDFQYFDARITIHTGPATYMAASQNNWSGYNTMIHDGNFSEGAMWYGAFRDFSVFKSWTTHRPLPPANTIVANYHYRHGLPTPAFIANQGNLHSWRQANANQNVWFAGTHTVDVDSQESALVSAVRVAQSLAPNSANLARLF